MSVPAVSVVITVFNRDRFIGEAIESVLAQTFADFEAVVQDDASTNRVVAERVLAYRDPRIRYERGTTNLHIAGNLNAAVRRCRAPYIHLLGDDDRMRRENLEQKVEFLERHREAGFVFNAPAIIGPDGEPLPRISEAWSRQYRETPEVCPWPVASRLFLMYGCLPGNISTVMLRRACLPDAEPFDTSFRLALDWDLWIRMTAQRPFGFLREHLVEIRSHSAQEGGRPGNFERRVTEVYRCLETIARLDPTLTAGEVRACRLGRYGYEFIAGVLRCLVSGHHREGWRALTEIVRRDGVAAPATAWLRRVPSRLWAKALGLGHAQEPSASALPRLAKWR
jgi:glycosyltransferase involved in cell wall biosynthesis